MYVIVLQDDHSDAGSTSAEPAFITQDGQEPGDTYMTLLQCFVRVIFSLHLK